MFEVHFTFHHSGNQKINFDPINVSFTSDQLITFPPSLHTRHIPTSLQRALSFVPLSNRMPRIQMERPVLIVYVQMEKAGLYKIVVLKMEKDQTTKRIQVKGGRREGKGGG